jgi:heterodisulfide reductase subunit B
MPIMFFTQLMGLAFGVEPGRLGIGTELVNPNKALAKIGVEPPEVETTARGKKKKETGLPMPTMPEKEEVL